MQAIHTDLDEALAVSYTELTFTSTTAGQAVSSYYSNPAYGGSTMPARGPGTFKKKYGQASQTRNKQNPSPCPLTYFEQGSEINTIGHTGVEMHMADMSWHQQIVPSFDWTHARNLNPHFKSIHLPAIMLNCRDSTN